MTGYEDWRIGFRRAMIDAMVRVGSPLDPNPSQWGWIHSDYASIYDQIKTVGIDYDACGIVEEVDWYEFQGTFHEGDHRCYGAELEIVLNDGSRCTFRVTTRLAEFIVEVIRTEAEINRAWDTGAMFRTQRLPITADQRSQLYEENAEIQRSYWAYRRNRDRTHDEALQMARDTVQERSRQRLRPD